MNATFDRIPNSQQNANVSGRVEQIRVNSKHQKAHIQVKALDTITS